MKRIINRYFPCCRIEPGEFGNVSKRDNLQKLQRALSSLDGGLSITVICGNLGL